MSARYDSDVVLVQIVVLCWHTAWVAGSVRALARGDRRTVRFVQLVFFFFFAVPQALDLVAGAPAFTYQRGFVVSQFDRTTNLVYLGYLALVPPLLAWFGGPPRPEAAPAQLVIGASARAAAWLAMLALPFAIVVAPRPELYTHYAAFIDATPGAAAEHHHVLVTWVALLAACAVVLVASAPGSSTLARLGASPFLALAIWVQGKRSIVALAILLLLYLLWMRGALRGRRFVAAALVGGVLLGGFSYAYQTNVRDVGDDLYVNYRIDYGRDAVTKQTIYAELHPDQRQILEYRGQSLVFDLLCFVPRARWPGKPFPYGVYVTAAMFELPPQDLGWGVTTSWLEEAIANFSWFGLVLGPLLPALVCRIGDRRRSPAAALLTVTTASFLLVLHVAAFLPIVLLWLIAMSGHRGVRSLQSITVTSP